MMKIEVLENKILALIDEFEKEQGDVKVTYESNYDNGTIRIKVYE